MGRSANDIINEARKYIGWGESNGKFRYIINTYNSIKPLPMNYAVKYTDEWCDTFISFLAIKCGVVDLIGRECSCERHIRIFKAKGIWIEDGRITPRAGDIILYNWDDSTQANDGWADHIGIVESVTNGIITTIEGNRNEVVARRQIPISWGYIRGYARPKYESNKKPVNNANHIKDNHTVAKEVLEGKWGNGKNRINNLQKAGYNYNVVQAEVNKILKGNNIYGKIAKEVLEGKWGNGELRKSKLKKAGYDYKAVQAEVNKMLKK